MKKFPIALQLYSVKNEMEKDFEGTLRAVAAMGYDGVEFAGLFGRSAAEVRAICEETGLTPVSAHVGLDDMANDPAVLETYAAIGCSYVAIPGLSAAKRPGGEAHGEMLRAVREVSARARAMGMKLCYHNHAAEFARLPDGEYILDAIYRESPADELLAELDLAWVEIGGEDPVGYLKKHGDRAEIVHCKDFVWKDDADRAAGPYMRPVGYGRQDYPAIVQAADGVGVKWLIVEYEEDVSDCTEPPLFCVERALKYLKSL